MVENLIQALTPLHLLLALGGVVAGTVIGSIPGLTATMAVAVLVPMCLHDNHKSENLRAHNRYLELSEDQEDDLKHHCSDFSRYCCVLCD